MKTLRKLFITGLFTLLPISITVLVLKIIYEFLDSISAPIIRVAFGFDIPGMGFLITVSAIVLVGAVANNFIGKKVLQIFDSWMHRIPFINTVYNSVKELSHNLSSGKNSNFSQVVLVNFPSVSSKSIGFITRESLMLSGVNRTAVFVPTTPNPTSGFIMFFDPAEVEHLDLTVDEAVKVVVSMGVVIPNRLSIAMVDPKKD